MSKNDFLAIKSHQRKVRKHFFEFDQSADALVAGTGEATMSKASTGTFTLTLNSETLGYGRVLGVFVTLKDGAVAQFAEVTAISAGAITILTTNHLNALYDDPTTDMYIEVVVCDDPAEHGHVRRAIKSSQLKVRQLYFEVDGTGTASIVTGDDEATLVDNGTGDYTLTLKDIVNNYKRFLGVTACAKTAQYKLNASGNTAGVIELEAHSDTSAQVDTDFYVAVAISDESNESKGLLRTIRGHQLDVRELYADVDGTGTASILQGTSEFTLTDIGTGEYDLTLKDNVNGQNRIIGAFSQSKTQGVRSAVTSISGDVIRVSCDDDAGSAADADFYIKVVVADQEERLVA